MKPATCTYLVACLMLSALSALADESCQERTHSFGARELITFSQYGGLNREHMHHEAPVRVALLDGKVDYELRVTYRPYPGDPYCQQTFYLQSPQASYWNYFHHFDRSGGICVKEFTLAQPPAPTWIESRAGYRTWTVGMDEFPGPLTVTIKAARSCP